MLYGGDGGLLCNIYAYGCLWCMWVGGSIIFQVLTDAYGGYGWVGQKSLNAYGCLRGGVGGWVCETLLLT